MGTFKRIKIISLKEDFKKNHVISRDQNTLMQTIFVNSGKNYRKVGHSTQIGGGLLLFHTKIQWNSGHLNPKGRSFSLLTTSNNISDILNLPA